MAETITPEDVAIANDRLEAAWRVLEAGAEAGAFGGAVALIQRHGRTVFHRAAGWAVREPEQERTPMALDTIFDLASLTKVVATTPSILRLVADERIGLDQAVGEILPEFGTEGPKAGMTIRRLLAHTSGIIGWRGVYVEGVGPDAYIASFARDQPEMTPGEQVVYSCPGFILLGEVVRRVTGEPVASYAARKVFGPLAMPDTMFTPPATMRERTAATEIGNRHEETMVTGEPVNGGWRTHLLRGEVHDGNAWYGFGGLGANAGLFGTAADLARYGQMWLNGGELDGARVLPEALVRAAVAEQTGLAAPNERRGLGWQLALRSLEAAGNHSARELSTRAFGHTGFTGTSLWVDPERELVIVLLTNRVHPTVRNDYLSVRARFTEMVAEACG